MKDYYGLVVRQARDSTAPWFSSGLALLGSALSAAMGILIGWRLFGLGFALSELGATVGLGLGGFLAAWGLIFFISLVRAPWLIDQGLRQEIAGLEKKLETRQAAARSVDWAALRSEFEKYSHYIDHPSLDWLQDHGWSFRGMGLRTELEALSRRGLKLAIQSQYCQSQFDLTVAPDDDPLGGWAEIVCLVVPSEYEVKGFYSYEGDKEMFHEAGSIKDPFRASVRLCLDLESRESESVSPSA